MAKLEAIRKLAREVARNNQGVIVQRIISDEDTDDIVVKSGDVILGKIGIIRYVDDPDEILAKVAEALEKFGVDVHTPDIQ